MATYRSRRGQPQPGLLARTVGQLVDRNRELRRRQDELEKRIRELEAKRGAAAAAKPDRTEEEKGTGSPPSPRNKK